MKKELNEKNKEVKSLNQKLTENLKKLREETNLRAKAEADVKAKESMIETLKEIMTLQKETSQQAEEGRSSSPHRNGGQVQEKQPELCRDFQRQGNCFRGNKCIYFHPPGRNHAAPQPDRNMKPDCRYWMEGYCRKEESQCWGKHNPIMCGSQPKQQAEATGGSIGVRNQNFVETLAKAVSQSMAGAQQQVVSDPSRGQNQVSSQPRQHMMNHQNMLNPQQQGMMNSQQQHIMSLQQQGMINPQQQNMINPQQHQQALIPMMIPNDQNMFFPVQQGGQGQ